MAIQQPDSPKPAELKEKHSLGQIIIIIIIIIIITATTIIIIII